MSGDTRAVAELPESERPVRIAPPLPDVESTAEHWHGPATLDAVHWRARAIAAEAEIEALRRALARYRYRP